MVRNAAIEGFNRHLKFPNAIIILCGDDFVNEDKYYLPSELEKKVRWVLRELDTAVKVRKSLVEPKCFTFGQPRIFWVRAFQASKNNNIPPDNLLKFNNMLRRVCAAKAAYSPDLKLYVDSGLRCFDRKNKVVPEGVKTLWLALGEEIKQIDEDDEQYAVNLKVEERLRELKRGNEKTFERQAHTYLSIKEAAGQRSDTVRNIGWDGNPVEHHPPDHKQHYREPDHHHNRSDHRSRGHRTVGYANHRKGRNTKEQYRGGNWDHEPRSYDRSGRRY